MRIREILIVCVVLFSAGAAYALEPNQILVIANSDITESVQIAQYYCQRREVPLGNILALPLGESLKDTITRDDYNKQLVEPIREKLGSSGVAGKIKCLLTIYGVPIKVEGRGPLKGQEDRLRQLKELAEQEQKKIEQLDKSDSAELSDQKKKMKVRQAMLQSEIDRILGKETNASVDSELSMVLFDDYELYRWQDNKLKNSGLFFVFRAMMVCRLDGPGYDIAKNLVDKALTAEKNGLNGIAYIDSGYSKAKSKDSLYYEYDWSLGKLAELIRLRTNMPVKEEKTEKLFQPGDCPQTAIYCGWYSLRNYVDAFDFVPGAIGFHISSLEAVDLRDGSSKQWCPAMLADGITATLGAVAEPYLQSFPKPDEFFSELLDGCCLVEAYYRTNPYNSWQLVLIGDPLYTPFKKF